MNALDPCGLGQGEPVECLDGPALPATGPDLLSAASLEALYRQHGPRLLRSLARRVGREDAGDLVQEAFARLASMVPGARAIERPEAFVTTVATNILRDRARGAARQALLLHACDEGEPVATLDPHRLTEGRQALQAIEQALATMNPRRRRIFMLHRFERLTYAEIGGAIGMSEKGVKKQIAKALVELRSALEQGS